MPARTPEHPPGRSFVRAFQPLDGVELALAKAAMEQMDVGHWHIENEHYFTTGGGFLSHGHAEIWVCVEPAAAERVRAELMERLR